MYVKHRWLISLVEHLKETEIVVNLGNSCVQIMKAFDREWSDQAIYHADEKG